METLPPRSVASSDLGLHCLQKICLINGMLGFYGAKVHMIVLFGCEYRRKMCRHIQNMFAQVQIL